VLEEGRRPRCVAHPACWWCPRSASRWRSWANRNLTALPEAGARRPAASRPFGRPVRTRHCSGSIRAKANELESLLLAVEVKPTNSSPLVAPPGLHRQPMSTICSAPETTGRTQSAMGLQCWRGQPTTAVRDALNGDTFQFALARSDLLIGAMLPLPNPICQRQVSWLPLPEGISSPAARRALARHG